MASYNFYLKDGKSKTETPIYLLFDDGVNRGKLYIQQSINPKDWNSEKWEARKSLQGFSDFNSKLNKVQTKCKELHTSLTKDGKFTMDILKREFKTYLDELNNRVRATAADNKSFETLYDFGTYFLKNSNTTIDGKMKKPLTNDNYEQTLEQLKNYQTDKRKKITFDKVTLDFYQDFIEYLTKDKGFKVNTIGKHVKRLKMFLNEATERGINKNFEYKSRRFKVPTETVESIYLNEEELLKIYNHDFSNDKKFEQQRDLFIIGCYTGLRFSDFSQLKIENISNDQISVKTQKTGETVVVPIHWTVKEILEKYSDTTNALPRPISNQKMNKYLKDIGKEAALEGKIVKTTTTKGLTVRKPVFKYDLITTHTARRSFATNLFLSGFPAISIMKLTGHKTEKSFMKYIKISQEENAKLLRLHWSSNAKLRIV